MRSRPHGLASRGAPAVRKAGGLKNARLHDLRHTVGTFAGQAGLNAFIVRDILGHRTLAMTDRYVSQDTDPLRRAADEVAGRVAVAFARKRADCQSPTICEENEGAARR